MTFIKTSNSIPPKTRFYRVRPLEEHEKKGVFEIDGLKYKKNGSGRFGRMNNHSLNVMYTSYHEFTAISECRLKNEDWFQLTRFESTKPINYYEIGIFSKIYFNTPRDSDLYKRNLKDVLGLEGNMDTAVRGFAALESALMDGIYSNHDDEISYLVSSVIADAIFSVYSDIDAVMFPSQQQRNGINIAFREEAADTLKITYSCVNKINNKYKTGAYKYRTYHECLEFDNPNLSYVLVADPESIWHHCYR